MIDELFSVKTLDRQQLSACIFKFMLNYSKTFPRKYFPSIPYPSPAMSASIDRLMVVWVGLS